MRSSCLIALALAVATLAGCAGGPGPSIFGRNAPPPWARPVAAQPYAAQPMAAPAVIAEPVPDMAPVAYVPTGDGPYTLGSGDKLRVVVFGQDGLSNSYTVDPSGSITMPLIGAVPARGSTTAALAQSISARLRQGFIREPHVAVEVEAYRPFFILGEVTLPGQYPYVANMTVETAGRDRRRLHAARLQVSGRDQPLDRRRDRAPEGAADLSGAAGRHRDHLRTLVLTFMAGGKPLRILHVLRAPVGGLFRHVIDLARGQAARGHQVGIIADASTGGARAEAAFATLDLALGLTRVPMSRHIGGSDVVATRHVTRRAADTQADVLHGHGAKGGAYARLASAAHAVRVYTPHGGSLHYGRGSPVGFMYLGLEQMLMRRTELFLFESAYGRDVFTAKIGAPKSLVRVVHNGVTADEFVEIAPQADATDIVFVGELRMLKGVDVLLDALAQLAREGHTLTATIVGDGPDAALFRAQAERLGVAARFPGAMPARTAFALGRCLIVPSRAESLPYIVLEAAAAALPLVVTNVGGIPEIFGPQAGRLVPPADAAALARAIAATTRDLAAARNEALTLRARVRAGFSVDAMTDGVLGGYAAARAGVIRRNSGVAADATFSSLS